MFIRTWSRRAMTVRGRWRRLSSCAGSQSTPAPVCCSRRRTRMLAWDHYPRTLERERLFEESFPKVRSRSFAARARASTRLGGFPDGAPGRRLEAARAGRNPGGTDRVPRPLAGVQGRQRAHARSGRHPRGSGIGADRRTPGTVDRAPEPTSQSHGHWSSRVVCSARTVIQRSATTAQQQRSCSGGCSTKGSSR